METIFLNYAVTNDVFIACGKKYNIEFLLSHKINGTYV